MLLKVALCLMLALGVLGAGTVAWVMLGVPASSVAAATVPVPKTAILVATHALRAGSLVKPEDMASLEIAENEVAVGASRDSPQGRGSLTGAMIRRSLGQGQPIMQEDVVHPGDHGFLAAVLGPDMRAISVAVDTVSGAAGLIWPGDRIDLILTQALDSPTLSAGRRIAAETVLTDARVIAVDQQLVQGQAPDGTVAPANRTATLEVTAAQAERVLVAGRLGKLSLSVLSADRTTSSVASAPTTTATLPVIGGKAKLLPPDLANSHRTAEAGQQTGGVTWAGDVSPALSNGETPSAPLMVHVFHGGSESKDFHF